MQIGKKDGVTLCKTCATLFTHKNGRRHQWQTSVSSSVRFDIRTTEFIAVTPLRPMMCHPASMFPTELHSKSSSFGEESDNYKSESRTLH